MFVGFLLGSFCFCCTFSLCCESHMTVITRQCCVTGGSVAFPSSIAKCFVWVNCVPPDYLRPLTTNTSPCVLRETLSISLTSKLTLPSPAIVNLTYVVKRIKRLCWVFTSVCECVCVGTYSIVVLTRDLTHHNPSLFFLIQYVIILKVRSLL